MWAFGGLQPPRKEDSAMTYENIEPGIFLARPNRFTARVLIRGRETVCHVKNTGRCRELLLPGASVLVQFHPDAKAAGRKTEYSLIAVWKNGVLINMDSQAPNRAAWEWLRTSPQLADLRREVTFENSRFDLAFTRGGNLGFMEVKGVTLEENGTARFPDAPTLRGVRHIRELTRMAGEGMDAAVLFVIQMKGVSSFEPNMATQPEFGLALRDAADAGVQILARDCLVSLDEAAGTLSLAIDAPVPVKLP